MDIHPHKYLDILISRLDITGPEYAGLREGDAVVAGGEGQDAVPGRGEARHDAVHLHTQSMECGVWNIELQTMVLEDYTFTEKGPIFSVKSSQTFV